MARSRVLQAAIKGDLEKDFAEFQKRTQMNDADAVRDLLTFALRIKLNDSEDTRPSNRELMEEADEALGLTMLVGVLDIHH